MGNHLQKLQLREEKKEEEETEENHGNFTCEICIEPTQSDCKFRNSNFCIHPFCRDCIAKYIQVKLDDNFSVGNIKCPGVECDLSLDPLSCMDIISKQLFDKWCDRLFELDLLQYKRCYCPHQDCSDLVVNECGDELTKIECPNCKKMFCFECKTAWHAGYWCHESKLERDTNDELMGDLIERNKWTRCYNCGFPVERVSGCKVITCRCGASFCHKCGNPAHAGVACRRNTQENVWNEVILIFVVICLPSVCLFVSFILCLEYSS